MALKFRFRFSIRNCAPCVRGWYDHGVGALEYPANHARPLTEVQSMVREWVTL